MLFGRTNVNTFLAEERHRNPALTGDFSMLINDIVRSCKTIAQLVSRGALASQSADESFPNLQDEKHPPLDALSNWAFLQHCERGGQLMAMSSSIMEDIHPIPADDQRGNYLLLFDPLNGATNIDVNLTVGSIFSVLHCPDGCHKPSISDFLQPGSAQIAAGYALYGSSTMLVLTVGNGTHGFTLDRELGEFILTHPNMQIPAETRNLSINTSNERFWEPPIRRYVEECLDGQSGIREKDFNLRWAVAMVANIHHILMRGGVVMLPHDIRGSSRYSQPRLLHKANPIAMIIEQAGGIASTGYVRIADIVPTGLHQQTPMIFGSRDEVECIEHYHTEYLNGDDKPFSSPLFSTRTLFRAE